MTVGLDGPMSPSFVWASEEPDHPRMSGWGWAREQRREVVGGDPVEISRLRRPAASNDSNGVRRIWTLRRRRSRGNARAWPPRAGIKEWDRKGHHDGHARP